jgi:hypothetical protein
VEEELPASAISLCTNVRRKAHKNKVLEKKMGRVLRTALPRNTSAA